MEAATLTRRSPPTTSSVRTRMSTSSLVTPSLLSREHRALLHVVRLVGPSLACSAASATSLARRERRPCLQITPLAVAAFVAGTALVALALVFRGMVRRRLAARPPLRCGTADCLRHAFRLQSALNRSVDPCHDFGAFVCGSAGGDVPDVRVGSHRVSVAVLAYIASDKSRMQERPCLKEARRANLLSLRVSESVMANEKVFSPIFD
ncbi:uncharacterized protein LOC142577971 [Dermacentor variabilis]|uniref:uncharacterized protein LOC142577971 n=1 Tax=Dermacentor variabilis TaxID=34621 RepID=UPI003F5CA314